MTPHHLGSNPIIRRTGAFLIENGERDGRGLSHEDADMRLTSGTCRASAMRKPILPKPVRRDYALAMVCRATREAVKWKMDDDAVRTQKISPPGGLVRPQDRDDRLLFRRAS